MPVKITIRGEEVELPDDAVEKLADFAKKCLEAGGIPAPRTSMFGKTGFGDGETLFLYCWKARHVGNVYVKVGKDAAEKLSRIIKGPAYAYEFVEEILKAKRR